MNYEEMQELAKSTGTTLEIVLRAYDRWISLFFMSKDFKDAYS